MDKARRERGLPLRAPGEAWLDGKEVVDVSLKIKDGVQWVKVPPGQSLASRSVASLALGWGCKMRRSM